MSDTSLEQAAEELADRLRRSQTRIVFAESCTAGLVAATLARIPGISEYLCGSAVVYRTATKIAWLGVSPQDLADESIGPVSEPVAAAMSAGILERTPEADLALSVTGHLGPDAPPDLDGVIYVGIARRDAVYESGTIDRIVRHTLPQGTAIGGDSLALRHERQRSAAEFVLRTAAAVLAAFE